MTLMTLVCPSAVLISKEVLTTAGTYSRTPPAGTAFWVAKARGAGGSIVCGVNNRAASGAGAFLQGAAPGNSGDSFIFTVGKGGGAGGNIGDAPSFSSIAKNSTTLMIAAAEGSVYAGNGLTAWAGSGGVSVGQQGQDLQGSTDQPGAYGGTQTANGADEANGYYQAYGGTGFFNGGMGAASGGGSSFLDSSLIYTASAAGVTQYPTFGGLTAATPGNPSDPDLGGSVGRGLIATDTNVSINGNDGGIVIAWYTGDPYAAGLLS